jgi:hypothetical protein
VKLLRTIALDPSDTFVFDVPAEPGDWAVSGAFRFCDRNPAELSGKDRSAFRSGFLGVQSWGWSTLAQIVHATEDDRRALVELLSRQLVERFGALFRPQRIVPREHSLLLVDEEVIGGPSPPPALSLMSMLRGANSTEIDVLNEENADSYWRRSDQFDLALDFAGGTRGPAALAAALTRWISHLLGVHVAIEPLTALRDAKLTWYVGLDTEATRMGDRLWRGVALDDRTASRVLALFRLTFPDSGVVIDTVGREPVYLILAMTSDLLVRMKPQNLLTGLPIKHLEAAT